MYSFSSVILFGASACNRHAIMINDWTQYASNPFVIPLEIPAPIDGAGGIIVTDLNNDGLVDYLITVPGHIAAYSNNGRKLWIKKTDVRIGGSSRNPHTGRGRETLGRGSNADVSQYFLANLPSVL